MNTFDKDIQEVDNYTAQAVLNTQKKNNDSNFWESKAYHPYNKYVDSQIKLNKDRYESLKNMPLFLMIFTLIWFILGVGGWFMSIYCFKAKGGSKVNNVIGLLISTFLGPFFWLYYLYMKKEYCKIKK